MTGVRVRELQDRSNARIALALAAVIIFALLLAWNEHHDRPYGREQQHLTSGAARPSNRDATTRPGWRDSDGNWVVAASPNGGGGAMHGFYRRFMERAKEGGVEQLEWARGRSVLFIGDSVLRDIVIQFCVNLKVDLREYDIFGDEHEEKDEKHLSWECIVPEVGLAWRSNMMFGLTQYDALPDFEEASAGLDWPAPPHDMDSRMKQLLPSLKSSPPDMLVVNMGAWDFKWMYRRDLFHHRKHDSIPQADLVEFAARLRLYFGLLQEACPTSKLVWMEMHPFSSNDTRAKWFWSAGLLPDVPDLPKMRFLLCLATLSLALCGLAAPAPAAEVLIKGSHSDLVKRAGPSGSLGEPSGGTVLQNANQLGKFKLAYWPIGTHANPDYPNHEAQTTGIDVILESAGTSGPTRTIATGLSYDYFPNSESIEVWLNLYNSCGTYRLVVNEHQLYKGAHIIFRSAAPLITVQCT
ncbi:hypothetical protein RQP46_009307 [Phenoliferia psychrophenolica]